MIDDLKFRQYASLCLLILDVGYEDASRGLLRPFELFFGPSLRLDVINFQDFAQVGNVMKH
jgi:hypothetical protein